MKIEVESETGRHLVEVEERNGGLTVQVDGRPHEVKVFTPEPGVYTLLFGPQVIEARVEGNAQDGFVTVTIREREWHLRVRDRRHRGRTSEVGAEGRVALTARMPGKVVRVLAEVGSTVRAGQGILVLEAMKMQNEVKAPKSGRLAEVHVREGQTVGAGELLAVIE
ncbi:MAG: biotin/lipoyl-binding protein [Blastocatellia bacterium]|nr:biotin/lipoyl-binding protein [Blastocatellia bacterium]MCS7158571.1 biotin/lipoyl-binding protein [Blastocatellia bacterium]MDW8169303.1 biotin/lipoyl-containing protein [Acidobacteriota bacterium]MDW8257767.1 biotin/lipoyl-containing protein [Acidobacteriota bacterium]